MNQDVPDPVLELIAAKQEYLKSTGGARARRRAKKKYREAQARLSPFIAAVLEAEKVECDVRAWLKDEHGRTDQT